MNIARPVFALLHVFTFVLILNAQQPDTLRVKLISAGILKYNRSINPEYQILQDNVIFEHKNSLLYCDVAHIYIHKDFVRAMGNVHIIVNDTTHLYGDTLTIDGEANLARMAGNVQLIDNQLTLTTTEIFYDYHNAVAYYLKGADIQDTKNFLTSKRGYYYHNSNNIFFKDSVYIKGEEAEIYSDSLLYNTITEHITFFGNTKIIDKEMTIQGQGGFLDSKLNRGYMKQRVEAQSASQHLKCDSLWFDQQLQYMEAFRSVRFSDYQENIFLSGHYLRFFEKDSTFFVTDSALLKIADRADTLYLHADSIYMLHDTIKLMQKAIFAHYGCRLWRHDFQAVADSMLYLRTDSVFYFLKNPILWMDSTQFVADTIFVTFRNNNPDTVFFINNAFIIIHEKENDYHQLRSSHMKGAFRDGELYVLHAIDDAHSIYYVFDEKKRLIGINIAHADSISIYFSEGQTEKIVLRRTPTGSLHPEKTLQDTEKFLEGFRWEKQKRPAHWLDVFRNPELQPYPLPLVQGVLIATDTVLHQTDSLTHFAPSEQQPSPSRTFTKTPKKQDIHESQPPETNSPGDPENNESQLKHDQNVQSTITKQEATSSFSEKKRKRKRKN